METVISGADPLIENPPSLFLQTSVTIDAPWDSCYNTLQITLRVSGDCI